jgi:hypothetical protein
MSKKMQRVVFPNGDEYIGHLNARGQPHGASQHYIAAPQGEFGDSKYVGTFKNGLKHGFGTCWWLNGTVWYEGNWENNLPNGRGRGVMANGRYFEGQVENGTPTGDVLMHINCVVDDCPHPALPTTSDQRLISRELATMLGRQAGDCASFTAMFRSQNYEGGMNPIDCMGTLADEYENAAPIRIQGRFREAMHNDAWPTFDIVDDDMPVLVHRTQEEIRKLKRLEIEKNVAARRRELERERVVAASSAAVDAVADGPAVDAAAAAGPAPGPAAVQVCSSSGCEVSPSAAAIRASNISKGQQKLRKFQDSKKGGRRKSSRKIRRRHHTRKFK